MNISTMGWRSGTTRFAKDYLDGKFRTEHDSVGDKEVPLDAYYGVQSLRAAENFPITGLNMHPEIVCSIVYIKKAAALTNRETGRLDAKKADAIIRACDEILQGKLLDNFIVDPIQGGAGTSLNMNANEVIANRAIGTKDRLRRDNSSRQAERIVDHAGKGKPGYSGGRKPGCL